MLTCKQLVEQSSELLDGDLSLRRRMALRFHLLLCSNCRRFMRQMALGRQVIRQLPAGESEALDQLADRLAEQRRREQKKNI